MAAIPTPGLPRSIAPEFDASLAWLNTAPIALAALRGHPVALLFWNAGSAHCLNALHAFAAIGARFREAAVFVAVHVPKFDAERDGAVALDLLRAEGLGLPLANDRDWVAWQHHELGAWPTAVLIDPKGALAATFVGDRSMEALASAVEAEVDANFLASPGLPPAFRVDPGEPRGALRAPAGLVANASRLYVADTGNHRILECTHDGRVVRRIGNGNRDFVDGLADAAGFRSPRGLALLQDRLYVADSGNHAIRRIHTRTGEVDTLVGNGRCGDPVAGVLAQPKDSPLDRPLALAVADSALVVGMGSGHQVWAFELGTGVLRRLSGSGRFGIDDGTAADACFAQPSALAVLGDQLCVLDAASSSLRLVRLADGSAKTLFGKGLFDFGNKDGGARQALMQGPSALALMPDGQGLWIADAGNGAIRTWVPRHQALATVTLPPVLRRPMALASWEQQLWIADAGAHAIWRFDGATGELSRLPVGE